MGLGAFHSVGPRLYHRNVLLGAVDADINLQTLRKLLKTERVAVADRAAPNGNDLDTVPVLH